MKLGAQGAQFHFPPQQPLALTPRLLPHRHIHRRAQDDRRTSVRIMGFNPSRQLQLSCPARWVTDFHQNRLRHFVGRRPGGRPLPPWNGLPAQPSTGQADLPRRLGSIPLNSAPPLPTPENYILYACRRIGPRSNLLPVIPQGRHAVRRSQHPRQAEGNHPGRKGKKPLIAISPTQTREKRH